MELLALLLLVVSTAGYLVVGGGAFGLGALLLWLGEGRADRADITREVRRQERAARPWLLAVVSAAAPFLPLVAERRYGLLPALMLFALGAGARCAGFRAVRMPGAASRDDGAPRTGRPADVPGAAGESGEGEAGGCAPTAFRRAESWAFRLVCAGSWATASAWGWTLAWLFSAGHDGRVPPSSLQLVAYSAVAVALLIVGHGLAHGVRRLRGGPFRRARRLTGQGGTETLLPFTSGAVAILPAATSVRLPLTDLLPVMWLLPASVVALGWALLRALRAAGGGRARRGRP